LNGRVAWLLLAFGGALVLLLKYRRSGETEATVIDALEEVVISVQRLTSWVMPQSGKPYEALFREASQRHGLPPLLLPAMAWRESRFRPDVIDGRTRSSKGAVGIMQIIPRWHPELGEAGALDPARAIPYAARFVRQLYNQFGDWSLAVAAYNWGGGNLSKDLADGIVGNQWPSETRSYVAEVSANAGIA
jgi:soluble lytic murein transglycosylase-like protein